MGGATYYYRIRATKAYGVVSAWSDIVSAVVRTPFLMSPTNITNAPINTDIISNIVTASDVSTPVYLFFSGIGGTNISLPMPSVEFRVNGGTWVTGAHINNGDQIEYKTQINRYNASMAISINFGGQISSWNITSSYGPPSLTMPLNITNAALGTDIISNIVTASNISTPVPLSVSGAEFRVN